jgi:SpoVK/Ycf46/Vps4 family AAA+-type ATPase
MKRVEPIEQINSLLKAQVPIIWVVTPEENRFIKALSENKNVSKNYKTWYWSATAGFVNTYEEYYKGTMATDGTKVVNAAIEKIIEYKEDKKLIAIMRDLHMVMQDATARRLRDVYHYLANKGRTLIITSPFLAHVGGSGLHPLLEKQVVVVDFSLPTQNEIEKTARNFIDLAFQNHENMKPTYTDEQWREISRSLQGLSIYEIENAIATSVTNSRQLDPEVLMQEKKQVIKKSNILEYIDTDLDIKDVGGLDLVKEYLIRYGQASTKDAEEFGVEPLRGIILTGIPGVGKSLLAKTAGHLWKLPLLRLDIGKVMGKLVGSSEENMRSAIHTMEAIAPAVVYLDELEKALSGTGSSDRSDGGTMSRVFGTLLTAMQEGLKGITIIATANNIENLPPELLRRFNEIFFVDLPSEDERWEIFKIHLEKRKRDIKNFIGAKKELLQASEGFTGAEIEKSIKDAIALAFYNKAKDVKPADIIKTLGETKPISKVQSENILKLQRWARDHARFASSSSRDKNLKHKEKTEIRELDLSDVAKDVTSEKTTTDKRKEQVEEVVDDRFSNLTKDIN